MGAAMMGGVEGHAGLFSTAYDLAMLYQMLLNGGEINGTKYLKPETIKLFTTYHNKNSRRGYGFDKPERPVRLPGGMANRVGGDNYSKKDLHPSLLASPETFGHTGFTGTCVWVDPRHDLVFIFLSNRVNPTRNNTLLTQMQIRAKIQDAFYKATLN